MTTSFIAYGGSQGDPYFTGVTLLLRLDDQFGAYTFRDSSVYTQHNYLVSSTGVVNGSSFAYFDGSSGAGLIFDTGQAQMGGMYGSNDFTIEFYFVPLDSGVSRYLLNMSWNVGVTNGIQIIRNANTTITVNVGDMSGGWDVSITSTSGVDPSAEAHLAVTRENLTSTTSKFCLWINGVMAGSQTVTSFTLTQLNRVSVGRGFDNTTTSFIGNMYNIRITNGVCRYTRSFDIPTNAYTFSDPNYASTVLMAHFDGTDNDVGSFYDASQYAIVLATYGTAKLSSAQKYFGTTSLLLDGAGYVAVNYTQGVTPSYDLGVISTSTNITIDFFVRFTTLPTGFQTFVAHGLPGSGGNGIGGWRVYTDNNGKLGFDISKNSSVGSGWYVRYETSSVVFTQTNAWYYVAVVVDAGVPVIFVNGAAQTATFLTTSSAYATSIIGFDTSRDNYGLAIGATASDSTNPVNSYLSAGYMDEVRVVKNRVASYFKMGNILNYGVPDPYYYSVKLLLHGDGNSNVGNIPDSSRYNRSYVSSYNVSKSFTSPKVGRQKLGFSPFSAGLTYASSSDWDLSSYNFTIEAWVQKGGSDSNKTWISRATSTASSWNTLTAGWALSTNSSSFPQFGVKRSSSILTLTSSVAVGTDWYHLAAVRQGNTIRLYVNGVQTATDTLSAVDEVLVDHTTGLLSIGSGLSPGGNTDAKSMDDIRVTIGVCRYPDGITFTPSTIPFYPNNDPFGI